MERYLFEIDDQPFTAIKKGGNIVCSQVGAGKEIDLKQLIAPDDVKDRITGALGRVGDANDQGKASN